VFLKKKVNINKISIFKVFKTYCNKFKSNKNYALNSLTNYQSTYAAMPQKLKEDKDIIRELLNQWKIDSRMKKTLIEILPEKLLTDPIFVKKVILMIRYEV